MREGKITPPELSAGTFTVSNLGMYGIRRFVAVINPPQAAILAVGELSPRPVVRDGEVVVRAVMELTLTCDHRILYGADAAEFLARIREYLEHPLETRFVTLLIPLALLVTVALYAIEPRWGVIEFDDLREGQLESAGAVVMTLLGGVLLGRARRDPTGGLAGSQPAGGMGRRGRKRARGRAAGRRAGAERALAAGGGRVRRRGGGAARPARPVRARPGERGRDHRRHGRSAVRHRAAADGDGLLDRRLAAVDR